MAEIDIQRKERSVWPWIIGVIVLILLAWWLLAAGDDDDDFDETPVSVIDTEPTTPLEPPMATPADQPITLAAVMAMPGNYVGQSVTGNAQVAEVVSDRGFWIEGNGQRIFAVIDEPNPEIKNVRAGQSVSLTGAQIMGDAAAVPGDLDAQTRQIISGESAFLYVRAANLLITGAA